MRQDKRIRQERALTVADLCTLIDRRQVPVVRQGDEYVMRAADVLQAQARANLRDDSLPEILRSQLTLEVGRSA